MRETKDSEERKEEFVNTAEKLFKENGIVDTTINNIVKELDVAKGLFYYYFKSKDDVIEAISKKYNEAFNTTMTQSMNGLNWNEKLNQLLDNSVQSFVDMHAKLKGESDDIDLSQLSLKSWEEAQQACKDAVQALLEEGKAEGKVMMENPEVYASMIAGGISYLVTKGMKETEEIKKMIEKMIETSGKEE